MQIINKPHNERGAGRKPSAHGQTVVIRVPVGIADDVKKQVAAYKASFKASNDQSKAS